MATLPFIKMHGIGNDYVYVDCFSQPMPTDPAALSRRVSDRHFGIGGDVRGIDQENKLRLTGDGFSVNSLRYTESLDTTYYGGYIGLGGEYSFGFIPGIKNVGGLYDRLGLRTFISARAGLYEANTDYDGRYALQFVPFNSKISKSNDDLAFIGTISLETRKQIGPRTSLSLFTDYEYISSVPRLHYSDGDRPTRIDAALEHRARRTAARSRAGL